MHLTKHRCRFVQEGCCSPETCEVIPAGAQAHLQCERMNRLGTNQARRGFRGALLEWYGRERRELPWRQTSDPYRIWVSEIMLQQTRVSAVLNHYRRFLERFPTVDSLARARVPTVLAAWSGLGYYRRARSLHAAARKVVGDFGGELPRTSQGLRGLPGVGRYTAAAIASIAFGEPVAVVDGNVERVLSRVYGHYLSRIQAWETAGELLDRESPGDFNQAMMELGAAICVPGEPDCGRCPVIRWCATRGQLARQGGATRRKAEVTFRLAQLDGRVLLVRRPKTASLMPEMWELPAAGRVNGNILFQLRHAITTTDYSVAVVAANGRRSGARGRWVRKQELSRLPLTGLARKILRRAALL